MERNKEVVRRIFEDFANSGRSELLPELFATDYSGVTTGAPPSGREAFAKTLAALREGFPDIRYSIAELIGDGDLVTVRWQWRGTHSGVFRGAAGVFPATGKSISNDGAAFFHVKDGKVTRGWVITDRLGFLQQIGQPEKAPATT
jgi:steroid delta-isomerase-like uncharacterized protein